MQPEQTAPFFPLEITNSDEPDCLKLLEKIVYTVGPPRNYGPSMEELEEEERKKSEERKKREAQEKAEKEEQEAEEARERAARWEKWVYDDTVYHAADPI